MSNLLAKAQVTQEILEVRTLNKTMMKHIQNNQKSIENSYQPIDFKNRKKKIREPKVSRLLPNVCDSLPSLWFFILCDFHFGS